MHTLHAYDQVCISVHSCTYYGCICKKKFKICTMYKVDILVSVCIFLTQWYVVVQLLVLNMCWCIVHFIY